MMAGNREYKISFLEEVISKDLPKLDGSQLVFVKKGLRRIKEFGMNCGQPLHGKLTGYRKLKNRKMGLRIIFGRNSETSGINIIDIVAIGKREKLEIYKIAQERIKKS